MSTLPTADGLAARWDGIRKRLPTVNPVFKGHPLHALLTDLPVVLGSAYLGGHLVYHGGWRVTPVEREKIETHRVPPTIYDDGFLLRRTRRA